MLSCKALITSLLLILSTFASFAGEVQNLHIYNWSDYIAPDTIMTFKKQTQINVTYDVFDSNEVLESKLMAGRTGFDLVVPTDSFLARQIKANIYQPLNKSLLPNLKHLDRRMLKMMEIYDPDNRYAIPYMWQSTGIGYNLDKVKAILGDEVPLDSWDLVFKPENLKKLNRCGVAFLDAPSEMYPTVLHYLGRDPNSQESKDYTEATRLLEMLRPYVTYFHNSKYISDLSGGDICIAIGWSGDVMQAADAAVQANHGVKVGYIIPKEGAIITFDVFAIPKDAKNVAAAHQFLNYLLEPKVIAAITNRIFYANVNQDAVPYIDAEVLANPGIYPAPDVMARLFPIIEQSPGLDRLMVRLWTRVVSGK